MVNNVLGHVRYWHKADIGLVGPKCLFKLDQRPMPRIDVSLQVFVSQ